jgi:hypothetical protein
MNSLFLSLILAKITEGFVLIYFWAGFRVGFCDFDILGGLGFIPIVYKKSKSMRFRFTEGSSF